MDGLYRDIEELYNNTVDFANNALEIIYNNETDKIIKLQSKYEKLIQYLENHSFGSTEYYNYIAGKILEEAMRLCPVDTGRLRDSGFARVDFINKAISIGFRQNYAVFVHENIAAEHKNGGIAKFLDRAYVQYIKPGTLVKLNTNILDSGIYVTISFNDIVLYQ